MDMEEEHDGCTSLVASHCAVMAENPSTAPPEGEPGSKRQKLSTVAASDDEKIQDAAPTLPRKPRYKRRKVAIFFAYCGVGYQGMQKNPGAKTIEGDLEEALYLSGAVPEQDRGQPRRYDWSRSARTDKGVSAVGQVVSGRFYVDPPGFVERLNTYLSPQIRIFGYKRVTQAFNVKKFCDRRRYVYLIPVFALDPSRHRGEIDNCLECAERGGNVLGATGKSVVESETVVEAVELGSGILSNTESASVEEKIEKVHSSDDDGTVNVDSEKNSINGTEEIKADSLNSNTLLNCSTGSAEKANDNGDDRSHTGDETSKMMECKSNGEESSETKSEFCYDNAVRERLNRILKYYEGTHNFHNFTTRTKAEDPSANRYILSFNANTVINVEGIDFIKCEVVGQSFMLHQIRKMIGLAIAIMRDLTPEPTIETAFQKKVNLNVPMAPEVGLYLDECFFTSYNKKWGDSHEELSMKDYTEVAEAFKMKYIYSHVASSEKKDGVAALWLHCLNRHYPEADNVHLHETTDTLPSSDEKPSDAITTDE
ncbi:uncharacterized protein LOC127246536 [Andrographis paniculata]|uniref:uncharacterized protein LOC127246536 n=1 Tax=Andrographis paniculata TaxID=175694 RepID=UPI0021E91A3B|nr:uncharacterized protein LOC127246536 [Andrographis paniculata]